MAIASKPLGLGHRVTMLRHSYFYETWSFKYTAKQDAGRYWVYWSLFLPYHWISYFLEGEVFVAPTSFLQTCCKYLLWFTFKTFIDAWLRLNPRAQRFKSFAQIVNVFLKKRFWSALDNDSFFGCAPTLFSQHDSLGWNTSFDVITNSKHNETTPLCLR